MSTSRLITRTSPLQLQQTVTNIPLSSWRCPTCRIRNTLSSTNPRPSISSKRHLSIAQLDRDRRSRERVVVLGSGWAGYTLARDLDARKYQVVVVSPRSYFVFTPLLASTSVGTLEFRTALEPVRSRSTGVQFLQGWADGIDLEGKVLTIEEAVDDPLQSRGLAQERHAVTAGDDGEEGKEGQVARVEKQRRKGRLFEMGYDKLIVAVGCYSQTFNTPGVKEHAYFLKDVGDARKIRNRLLACFETAALPTTSEAMKKQLLNFAVVGGGPTGIEFSAEMHDIIAEDMKKLYPELVPYAHITVYDVAPKVLSMFDDKLGQYAARAFQRQGISIRTSHHVQELRAGAPKAVQDAGDVQDSAACYTIKLQEEGEVGVGMCVWSTGLMMNPFVERVLSGKVAQHEKSHGILINDRMQALTAPSSSTNADTQRKSSAPAKVVPGLYALGDCAVIADTAYPATAQVANQQARWLAKRLNKNGDISTQPGFSYKDLGVMAYIGNWNAILQSSGGDVSGRMAWFVWRGAYLAKSVSWRNRILIPVYWLVNWVFGRDISRF